MRKCAADVVPECFSMQAENQCKECQRWFCNTHIVTHSDSQHKVSTDDTDITMFDQKVILDETIPKGEVRIHPHTFCLMAATALRENINGVITLKV